MNRWDLVDLTHRLPEYKDPEGSTKPLNYYDVLIALEYGDEEARELQAEIDDHILLAGALSG